MMKTVLLFLLALTAWFSTEAGADNANLGVWSGTLIQMVVAGQQYEEYEATVTVTPDEYRVDYDSLDCGGVMHLLKQRGRFYRFREELDYGLSHCDNGGHAEIHFINSGLAAFQWFDKNGVLKVEGRLKRWPQLMI